MDAIELELFRAGPSSRGITAADLAEMASTFDGSNPCPVVIGHRGDEKAHGEVASFRVEGNSLFGQIRNLGQAVVDGVKKGELLNRSMKFFPKNHSSNPTPGKLAPWHCAFLGKSAPGIPNMPRIDKALAFDAEGDTFEVLADPAPALIEEEAGTEVVTIQAEPKPKEFSAMPAPKKDDPKPQTAEEIAAAAEALAADRAAFDAERQAEYETANEGRVDALIAGGHLLPKDKDRTLLIFNAIEPEALEFEAGKPKRSPASELAALLGDGVKLVPLDEKRRSPSTEFKAGDKDDDPQAQARKLSARAKELQAADSSLSFEAAIEAAQAEQEG